ncbi:hypothetical protein K4Q30_03070 [Staphylococcus epidermidis]|nr:hypothetical protein [Staphylococcus epidermidis]
MDRLQITFNIINPIITIGGFIFVHLRFRKNLENTQKQFQRKIRDSLDSKSGWRKELFKIAGKVDINYDDVYQFRSALRFNEKENDELKNSFDKMNNIMIKYCKSLTKENDIKFLKRNTTRNKLTEIQQEIIRLFVRYMLKDHWEKNQDDNYKIPKDIEDELIKYTLTQFIRLKTGNKNNYDKCCLVCLFRKANKLI